MELKDNDAAVCIDATDAQAGTPVADEIDLYGELLAFAELSPEDQSRIVARQAKASAEAKTPPAGNAVEHFLPDAVLTQAATEPVDAESETSEIKNPATTVEEYTSSETAVGEAPIGSIAVETSTDELVARFAEEAEKRSAEKAVPTPPSIGPVEIAMTLSAAESASLSKDSNASGETTAASPPAFEGSRQSGPLSGLNLPPNIVYTGVLSRGVCLACGAGSGVDDLFCVTCGTFIDEIAFTLPVDPTRCGECKQRITANEIFCPWCGSVLLST